MSIAVIPARGGSKRIPGKNIRPFLGTPIIARVIKTALSADCFDRIIVSTDNEAIADIARGAGAEVPFTRPAALADDMTSTSDVMAHAVEALASRDMKADIYCLIYPTAVFATPDNLNAGRQLLLDSGAEFCFPIVDFEYPIQRAVTLKGGRVHMMDQAQLTTRSQDLKPAYHDAGQYYWGRRDAFLQKQSPFTGDAIGQKIPRYFMLDIDTNEDWQRAEVMYQLLQEQPI